MSVMKAERRLPSQIVITKRSRIIDDSVMFIPALPGTERIK